jgi:transposase-like protein
MGNIRKSMTLLEFQQQFATEEACAEHLFHLRWPNGFICPRCGGTHYSLHGTRRLWECLNMDCRYQASLTAGTILHGTRTPLRKWFWAMFLMVRQKSGVSAMDLSRLLSVSYKTAWSMMHKLRKAMADRNARYLLTGIIEMDDSYFGAPRPGKHGRGAEDKAIVLVSVEERGDKPGYLAMTVVDSVSGDDLSAAAATQVAEGQTIKTDGFPSYPTVASRGKHRHDRNVVSYHEVNKVLPWVHIVIGNVKSFLQGTYHGVSVKHLGRYLHEFIYRTNRRFIESQLFDALGIAAMSSTPMSYSILTG